MPEIAPRIEDQPPPEGVRVRPTARILLLDPEENILLFKFHDPNIHEAGTDPALRAADFWATPGGGVEPGEELETAAKRELFEETGLSDIEVGPLVFRQKVLLHMRGGHVLFDSHFFLVRCPKFDVSLRGLHGMESTTFAGFRWWSRSELESTEEVVFPEELVDIMRDLFDKEG